MRYKDYKKYKLPNERYHELLWFTWQYAELKDERQALASIGSPVISGMPHSSGVGDPTGEQAVKFAELDSKIRMIEECCMEAGADICIGLLKGVTTRNCTPTWLRAKGFLFCGNSKYYAARRKYFWLLDKRRG